MNDQLSIPYSAQVAYLPADSGMPGSLSQADKNVFQRVSPFCLEVIKKSSALEEDMCSVILPVSELSNKLNNLNESILVVFQELQNEFTAITESASFDTSDQAIRGVLESESEEVFKGCSIYDKYFNVMRVSNPTTLLILGQVARTAHLILNDLEFAMVSRDQVVFIINNIKLMFQDLVKTIAPQPSDEIVLSARMNYKVGERLEQGGMSEENDTSPTDWTYKVARYRWITGHHLFSLASIFCINFLNKARCEFEKGMEEEGVTMLRQAGLFLRGTTASMWYAASMPGKTYMSYIRPSMISQETPNGFSGDQNTEYKRLKNSKALLEKSLLRLYGAKRTGWPGCIKEAVDEFVEFDTLDCEAHTLIAAAMAGMDNSISQKQWQQNLPPGFERLNAVDLLREITLQRRQSFGGQI